MAGKTITPELTRMTEKKGQVNRSGARAVAEMSGLSAESLYLDGKRKKVVDMTDNRRMAESKKDSISVVLYGDKDARDRYVGFAESDDGIGIGMATYTTTSILWASVTRGAS
eukprot:sb/3477074/